VEVLPEVALHQLAEVLQELERERVIHVVLRAHLLDVRRGAVAVAALAGEGIAGQGPDQPVDEERGAEQHRYELQ
jgi:hypothetical protein